MEEKALRLSAVFLMILTAVSFVLLPKLPALHTWEVEAREERIAEEEFAQSQVTMQNLKIKEQNEAAGAKGGTEYPPAGGRDRGSDCCQQRLCDPDYPGGNPAGGPHLF